MKKIKILRWHCFFYIFIYSAARPPTLQLVNPVTNNVQVTAGSPFTVELKAAHVSQNSVLLAIINTTELPLDSSLVYESVGKNECYGKFTWTPSVSLQHPRSYNLRYDYCISLKVDLVII